MVTCPATGMDLKSGSLFWPARDKRPKRHAPLKRDLKCEVAIIGGGLTGALAAWQLVQSGFDVVLVDKRDVAQGSTSASTALILYEIDLPLIELRRRIGKAKADRAYKLCRDAIYEIEEVVPKLDRRCEFARTKSLYIASSRRDIPALRRECRARQEIGLNASYLREKELRERFGVSALGALMSVEAAQIDPYRFAHALVESSKGLRVFGRTEVKRIESTGSGMRVRTSNGHQISAKRVIVAAGYESSPYIPKKLFRLRSTYAVAARPVKGRLPEKFILWETATPYVYMRSTADGRILAGGEDENFCDPEKRDALIGKKAKALEKRLGMLIPKVRFKAERAWAGTFGESKDGLPCIGTKRGRPNVFYALCYGANGTNFAMIAANMALDWMQQKRSRDAAIFSLYR